jgi:acetamidase/formamidase
MKITKTVPEQTIEVDIYSIEHHFGTGVIAVRDTRGQVDLDLPWMLKKHGKLTVKEYLDTLVKEAHSLQTLEKSITDEFEEDTIDELKK